MEIIYSTPNNQTCYIHCFDIEENSYKKEFVSIMNINRCERIIKRDQILLFHKKVRVGEEKILQEIKDVLKEFCRKNKFMFTCR